MREYPHLLERERAFWDHFNEDAVKYGIPHWLDLQKAQRLHRPIWSPFDDPRFEEILRGRMKKKFLQKAIQQGGKVLDAGCGMGWLSLELARAGLNVDACDLSPRSIEIAKAYAEKEHPPGTITYQVADLNTLSLPEETYDLVVVWDVVHHLLSPARFFAEIRKSLKPGGLFLLFDHIGMQEKNLRFYRIFHYFVPAALSMYLGKIRHILGKSPPESPERTPPSTVDDSPFEHKSEQQILPALLHIFPGISWETHLCFAMHLAHYHRLPSPGKYLILKFLKKLDDWFIQKKVFRGEYVFAEWKKPEEESPAMQGAEPAQATE